MSWFKDFLKNFGAPEENFGSNFTPRAQEALGLARKESDRLHHNYLGTEHVLLGLIALGQGVAVNVLSGLGLNLENVRTEVEKLAGTGPDENSGAAAPYTPRVKEVLDFARKEAKALHHTYIGTEHLLLGLLREDNGLAAQVLRNFNVDLEQVRVSILKELDPNFTPGDVSLPSVKPNNPFVPVRQWLGRHEGEDFTPRAIETLALARDEAKRLRRHSVGTEHVLLGLIRMEKGVAANVLKNVGLTLEKTRSEVEKLAGIAPDEEVLADIPYTPRTRHVLAMAKGEAITLCHTYIGTESLLLALLRENDGLAAQVFKNFKVDMEQLRKTIYDELKPPGDNAQKNK